MSIQSTTATTASSATTPQRPVERAASEPTAPTAAPRAAADAADAPAAAAPSHADLTDAVANINKSMQAKSQSLEFSIDEDSQRTIVKVVDQATKEVIRQIPTPEALEISKALDSAKGLLIRQTA